MTKAASKVTITCQVVNHYDGRVPRNSDTSNDAERFRTAFLRSLTGEQRAKMAAEMTEVVHNVTRKGIADRHPEYTPDEVQLAFVRLLLGDKLFRGANPTAPLLAP
jgi:hypothetical protein